MEKLNPDAFDTSVTIAGTAAGTSPLPFKTRISSVRPVLFAGSNDPEVSVTIKMRWVQRFFKNIYQSRFQAEISTSCLFQIGIVILQKEVGLRAVQRKSSVFMIMFAAFLWCDWAQTFQ